MDQKINIANLLKQLNCAEEILLDFISRSPKSTIREINKVECIYVRRMLKQLKVYEHFLFDLITAILKNDDKKTANQLLKETERQVVIIQSFCHAIESLKKQETHSSSVSN